MHMRTGSDAVYLHVRRVHYFSLFHHEVASTLTAAGSYCPGLNPYSAIPKIHHLFQEWRAASFRTVCYTYSYSPSIRLRFYLLSFSISMTNKPSTPLELSATDTLKVTFQVVDKSSGKGVQPQQVFLRFYDEESGEEGIQPLRVASTGKVKFELVCCLVFISRL